jgi:hypothetical protein
MQYETGYPHRSACNTTAHNEDVVAALPTSWIPADCQRLVGVARQDGGAIVDVYVVASCADCGELGQEDVVIALSLGAWKRLAIGESDGDRIAVNW